MLHAEKEYLRWLNYPYLTKEEKNDLLSIQNNAEEITLRFASPMSFGTAGLRSTMHMGPGCMNNYTVASTTAGLATLVLECGGANRGVAIAFDSRNNSATFAKISAEVLSGYGVRAYLFDALRPTPELSFAVKHFGCMAGINITASHNPKEYNGYKAYWEDGAQLAPNLAAKVADYIAKIDVLGGVKRMPLEEACKENLVTILDEKFDDIYLSAVKKTAINPALILKNSQALPIVYTPLNGAGYRLVPKLLSDLGLSSLYTVPEQMEPNGDFPTVKKPNPEYADVFALGIAIAEEKGSNLVIATDPDADRVGVMSRTKDGSFKTITGNQMGALLLNYVIKARTANGSFPKEPYTVKSLVSTELAKAIAEKNGVAIYDVFTGFKFIGEVISQKEAEGNLDGFLCGFEESYGYLFGSYALDKDAVGATMMIVEMTAFYHEQGLTLSDALEGLYATYGLYCDGVLDLYMEGLDGIAKRKKLMASFRENTPKTFSDISIDRVIDYQNQTILELPTGKMSPTGLEKNDVITFCLHNGDKVIVRPSGTEPKVKFYFLCHGENKASLEAKIAQMIKEAERLSSLL